MKADIVLADFASVDPTGKFNVVGGGISRITSNEFPCTHPSLFVFIRFFFESEDSGKNRINVRFIGEKGNLFRAEATLDIAPAPNSGAAPLAIHLMNTRFEMAGEYHIEVLSNGRLIALAKLFLDQRRTDLGS